MVRSPEKPEDPLPIRDGLEGRRRYWELSFMVRSPDKP